MRLRDVQASLRAGIESRATAVGPFLVLLNTTTANPFMNYAVPADGAAPTPADVAELVKYFVDRDRLPRLEYVRPAPDVDAALGPAGFDVTATLGLMAVDEVVPVPELPDYTVEFPTETGRLRQTAAVQDASYDEQREPDPARLLATLRAGGCVALAVAADGEPVGAGLFTAPQGGLVEIAGVGVLPVHRRHGVGRQLTTALTVEALRRGHQPFLQVEHDEPARLYERIGYRTIGEMADARLRRGDG